jgi:hypothetical protein
MTSLMVETSLPSPMTGRVELLIYWRVLLKKYLLGMIYTIHDFGDDLGTLWIVYYFHPLMLNTPKNDKPSMIIYVAIPY